MGRTSITENNRSSDQPDQFPRLKMTTTGEVARLIIPEDGVTLKGEEPREAGPWMEWVHTMRAPNLDEQGRGILVSKTRKNGSSYDDYDTGFVGQRLCLGDPKVLGSDEIDPDRCPACAAAKDGVKDMKPERAYAIPVIRYKAQKPTVTQPLANPPSADVLIWRIGQRMYNKLLDGKADIANLLEIPDGQDFHLKAADIVVYCEDGGWQRLVFKPPLRPAYRANERVGQMIAELWGDPANRPTDAQLKAACGRDGDRAYMMIDVDDVRNRWRKAEGGEPDPTGGGSLTSGLDLLADDLLGPESDPLAGLPGGMAEFAQPADQASVAALEAGGDPLGSDLAAAPVTETAAAQAVVDDPFGDAPAPAPEPAAPANGQAPKVRSFDDILG